MEELLRRELGCGSVRATGHTGGGCISQGRSYDTDRGRVFVKVNPKAEVRPRVGRAGGPVSVPGRVAGLGAGRGLGFSRRRPGLALADLPPPPLGENPLRGASGER